MLSDAFFDFEEHVRELEKSVLRYCKPDNPLGYTTEDLNWAKRIVADAMKVAKDCERFRMRPGFDMPPTSQAEQN